MYGNKCADKLTIALTMKSVTMAMVDLDLLCLERETENSSRLSPSLGEIKYALDNFNRLLLSLNLISKFKSVSK